MIALAVTPRRVSASATRSRIAMTASKRARGTIGDPRRLFTIRGPVGDRFPGPEPHASPRLPEALRCWATDYRGSHKLELAVLADELPKRGDELRFASDEPR